MKKYIWILLCLLFSGCVSFEVGEEPQKIGIVEVKPVQKPLTKVGEIYVGMMKDEVLAVMGDQVMIGYDQIKGNYNSSPIYVQSPYHAEILTDAKVIYEVMYYFTHINKADGVISDEELTPLVFEKNKLIGKGQDFLFKLKNTLN